MDALEEKLNYFDRSQNPAVKRAILEDISFTKQIAQFYDLRYFESFETRFHSNPSTGGKDFPQDLFNVLRLFSELNPSRLSYFDVRADRDRYENIGWNFRRVAFGFGALAEAGITAVAGILLVASGDYAPAAGAFALSIPGGWFLNDQYRVTPKGTDFEYAELKKFYSAARKADEFKTTFLLNYAKK